MPLALTREQKIVRAIDRALDGHRASLTPWEINFLHSLLMLHRRSWAQTGVLSIKQKNAALRITSRLKIPLDY